MKHLVIGMIAASSLALSACATATDRKSRPPTDRPLGQPGEQVGVASRVASRGHPPTTNFRVTSREMPLRWLLWHLGEQVEATHRPAPRPARRSSKSRTPTDHEFPPDFPEGAFAMATLASIGASEQKAARHGDTTRAHRR